MQQISFFLEGAFPYLNPQSPYSKDHPQGVATSVYLWKWCSEKCQTFKSYLVIAVVLNNTHLYWG